MEQLTTKQIARINEINYHTKKMGFGTKIQEIIAALTAEVDSGTPVNAVNATRILTITGAINGETVTIDNPTMNGSDVYEFRSDVALAVTNPGNIAVNINSYAAKASNTLTLTTQPIVGDTMTIGTKLYTFVANGADRVDGGIGIGTSLATAKTNVVAAINGTDLVNTPHPLVSASAFNVNVCTITALVGGVAGNSIPTTETLDGISNVFSAATLGGGGACSAANAVTALVAAINANDTQGVGADDGAGDTVNLTADVAGVVGNAIVVGETMTGGSFTAGATLMSGGVDGTIGFSGQRMVDSNYEYRCTATNTTAGKNWRRISLGSAY